MPQQIFTPQGHLTRRLKRVLKRIVRDADRPARSTIHTVINKRAEIVTRWSEVAVDGRIDICREGTDCDGTHYTSFFNVEVPVSVIEWVLAEAEHRAWLDGPERVWFERPAAVDNQGYIITASTAYARGEGWR